MSVANIAVAGANLFIQLILSGMVYNGVKIKDMKPVVVAELSVVFVSILAFVYFLFMQFSFWVNALACQFATGLIVSLFQFQMGVYHFVQLTRYVSPIVSQTGKFVALIFVIATGNALGLVVLQTAVVDNGYCALQINAMAVLVSQILHIMVEVCISLFFLKRITSPEIKMSDKIKSVITVLKVLTFIYCTWMCFLPSFLFVNLVDGLVSKFLFNTHFTCMILFMAIPRYWKANTFLLAKLTQGLERISTDLQIIIRTNSASNSRRSSVSRVAMPSFPRILKSASSDSFAESFQRFQRTGKLASLESSLDSANRDQEIFEIGVDIDEEFEERII